MLSEKQLDIGYLTLFRRKLMNTVKFQKISVTELESIIGGKAWYLHVADAVGSFFSGFVHGF